MPDKYIERLMRVITRVLAVAFLLAILLNFANVIGRYVFSRAILGADEIQIFVMIWMAFLAVVVVSWRRQHLRMDVLFGFLPGRVQKALRLFEVVLFVVLSGVVAVQAVRFTVLMANIGRKSDAAGIPMVVPHSAAVLGFSLLFLLSLTRLASKFRRKSRTDEEAVVTDPR